MEERARRIGENEALFREVNRRIVELDENLAGDSEQLEILCECGHRDCLEHIAITLEDYRKVRAEQTTFAVLPGHELPEVEEVVAKREGFVVVRKNEGEAAEQARET